MEKSVSTVREIFAHCFAEIGGGENEDVRWYYKRPKTITRRAFFKSAVWAIWVSGMSRKAASAFLERAERSASLFDYREVSSWDGRKLRSFAEKLHGRPVPKRSMDKWKAVHWLGTQVRSYETESAFRTAFFGGKKETSKLDDGDVDFLTNLRLPFIREANASFIVRNMGAEAVKPDRWLQAFLAHYSLTKEELVRVLSRLSIPSGLFDLVVWCYCEEFVGDVKNFKRKFAKAFDKGREIQ